MSSTLSNSAVTAVFTTVLFNTPRIPSLPHSTYLGLQSPQLVLWSFFFFQHLFWLLLGGVQPGTLPPTLPLISPFYSRLLDVSFYFTLSSEYTKHLTHLTFLKHNSHFPSVLPNPQEGALPSTNVATQKKSMGVTTHPSLALPFCFKFLPPLWKDSQAYSPLPTSAIIVLTCLDCSFSHLAELFLTLLYPHRWPQMTVRDTVKNKLNQVTSVTMENFWFTLSQQLHHWLLSSQPNLLLVLLFIKEHQHTSPSCGLFLLLSLLV